MHSYTLFAALAMAVAVKASPIAQADAPDAAAGINIQAAAVESASAEATAAASGDVLGEDVPPATDLGEIDGVDLADVDVAGKDCGLDPDSAKSWSESGAEKYLEDWLKTNGEGNWLKELARNHSGGRTVAINCATAETNTCGVTPEPADCDNYEYYFVRLMASRINSAFSHLHERLQSNVIEKALDVSGIAETFKPPEPKESKLEKNLNNIALGPSILSTLVGFAPGGGAASGMLSLFGTAITTAASNLDEKKIEIPSFGEVTSKMDARLKDFFVSTEKELQKSLAAIFGESKERPEDAKKTLSSMIEKMGNAGVEDVNKDSDNPIHEILKGGEWLVPVEDSKIAEAMSKAFSTVQHGLIGNLLNSYQVYVEEELPEAKHKPSGCAQLGTLLEQDRCFVIKRRDDSKSKGEILEEKYLKAFADYGLDIHTLIRNVVECNNDEADTKALRTDGAYPRCYFGMAFARKVHVSSPPLIWKELCCPSNTRAIGQRL